MSGEEKPLNPCDLFLPKDYEDDLQYRQTQPEINTDTSDDDDRQNSRQTSPVNTTSDESTLLNPFALLQNPLKMANQSTGANFQQLGDGTSSVSVAPIPLTLLMSPTSSEASRLILKKQAISHLTISSKSTES